MAEGLAEVLAAELLAEGGGPGNSLHSWRCEYPDRYGPCTCVEETARAQAAAALAWVAERLAAEGTREVAAQAVYAAWSLNTAERGGWNTATEHAAGMADAALAAVRGVLLGGSE